MAYFPCKNTNFGSLQQDDDNTTHDSWKCVRRFKIQWWMRPGESGYDNKCLLFVQL